MRSNLRREDLMREATALASRLSIRFPQESEPWIVGFRTGGAASFFFGEALVAQFNERNEWRRGFADGVLLKANNGKVISLTRERSETETNMLSLEWSASESMAYFDRCQTGMDRIRNALQSSSAIVEAEIPPGEVASRVLDWLEGFKGFCVADSPRVGG